MIRPSSFVAPRRNPTLASLTASQVAAIRTIPAHGTGTTPSIQASRPAHIFLSEERFLLEQARVFRRFPVPVTASAVVPEPGRVVAIDSYGTSLLVARAQDGRVRTFHNVCMHKGARLVEETEPRAAARLSCPYHAWTYALDGTLVGVPRSETFVGLCKEQKSLRELACREAGGFVWVGLDRTRDYDFGTIDDGLVADLEALDLPRLHLYGRRTFDLKANWKLVLEPFLEAYHVQRLHARSVGPLFADVSNVCHLLGRNIRQISGKMNYSPDVLDVEGENIHKSVTHAYQVFPNGVVVTSPYYVSLMILAPRAAGRTIVDYMMLTRGAPATPEAEDLFKRSYDMILAVFGGEDFRAAQIAHEGLASGALDEVVYGGMEEMIPRYYDLLEQELEAPGPGAA
ncbi:MAG TPA: aromatic ring-hydroxylating dioxygenase subunit alpha [Nevskiaceae bacterium]|nr:aromatic ring-hydroxylating dioxygenase subunit alpha [Nevskiaceae bacterium]